MPKTAASAEVTRPLGRARLAVRRIRASRARSIHWFSVLAPPRHQGRPQQREARRSPGGHSSLAPSRKPTPTVTRTITTILGFVSETYAATLPPAAARAASAGSPANPGCAERNRRFQATTSRSCRHRSMAGRGRMQWGLATGPSPRPPASAGVPARRGPHSRPAARPRWSGGPVRITRLVEPDRVGNPAEGKQVNEGGQTQHDLECRRQARKRAEGTTRGLALAGCARPAEARRRMNQTATAARRVQGQRHQACRSAGARRPGRSGRRSARA